LQNRILPLALCVPKASIPASLQEEIPKAHSAPQPRNPQGLQEHLRPAIRAPADSKLEASLAAIRPIQVTPDASERFLAEHFTARDSRLMRDFTTARRDTPAMHCGRMTGGPAGHVRISAITD